MFISIDKFNFNLQNYTKLQKSYERFADTFRPYGINFYHVKSNMRTKQYSDLCGKVVMYYSRNIWKENMTRMFSAAGKTETELGYL